MGGSVLLGFGPYVGIGLGGNEKTDKSGVSLERSIKYKSSINAIDLLNTSEVYYKPIDAGVNLLAGYEFSNGFSFQVNAQLGLTNINPDINGSTTDKTALKNTGFGISLGYRIRK